MGWCHEFGLEIEPLCSHPMVAGRASCSCPECGTVCPGRFEGGCESVFQRGPRTDAPGRPSYETKSGLQLIGAAPVPSIPVASTPVAGVPGPSTPVANGVVVNGSHPNGVSITVAGPAPTGAGAASSNGAGPSIDALGDRIARLETTVGALVEQLAAQSQLRASTERHLADLGQVLGQLGVDMEDRLALIELVLADLGAQPSERQAGADSPIALPTPDLSLPSVAPSVSSDAD